MGFHQWEAAGVSKEASAQWGCSTVTFHIQICHSNGILATFKAARLPFLHCWNFYRQQFFLLFGFITVSEEDCTGSQCGKGNWWPVRDWLPDRNTSSLHLYTAYKTRRGISRCCYYFLWGHSCLNKNKQSSNLHKIYFSYRVIPALKHGKTCTTCHTFIFIAFSYHAFAQEGNGQCSFRFEVDAKMICSICSGELQWLLVAQDASFVRLKGSNIH